MVKTKINKIFLGNARKRKHGLIMVLSCVWNVISGVNNTPELYQQEE